MCYIFVLRYFALLSWVAQVSLPANDGHPPDYPSVDGFSKETLFFDFEDYN